MSLNVEGQSEAVKREATKAGLVGLPHSSSELADLDF
jgi:hypothetical protein